MNTIAELLKAWDNLSKKQIKEHLILIALNSGEEPPLSVSDMSQILDIAEITVRVKAAKHDIGSKLDKRTWVFRHSDIELFRAIPSTPGPKPKKPVDS